MAALETKGATIPGVQAVSLRVTLDDPTPFKQSSIKATSSANSDAESPKIDFEPCFQGNWRDFSDLVAINKDSREFLSSMARSIQANRAVGLRGI